ncbi:MAG TPA: hypothetical protein VKQ29_15530 [Aliidongia sp.]|nr:hypothetical protein [Aliidongia sp.]
MHEHTHSVIRLFMPLAALVVVAGLGACVTEEHPTVTKTETTRTTTTPGYTTVTPAPVTSGTTTTQTTINKSDD